jgi:hypothetical protein
VFGYNLLVLLHALCGQLLKVHPTHKVNKFWKILIWLVEFLVMMSATFCLATAAYTVFNQRNELKAAIYVSAGFLGIFECLFRIVYTAVRKRKMEKIFERMQAALNFSINGLDKKPIARKISRCVNLFGAPKYLIENIVIPLG